MLRAPLYWVVRALCFLGFLPLLARFYASRILKGTPASLKRPDAPYTLLALNPNRFRGDLDCLAGTGQFNILIFPFQWQCRILSLYWYRLGEFTQYFAPPENSRTAAVRKATQRFLAKFLPLLFQYLGVDAVISAALHYKQDTDYGEVANDLGYPYIVFHRENFITNKGHMQRFLQFYGSFNKFKGSLIATHNEVAREAFIRTVAEPDQVKALGCLRMDEYLERVRKPRPPRTGKKRVALFSFVHVVGLFGFGNSFSQDRSNGFIELFDHVHGGIARLAAEMHDTEFVIKPKWAGTWLDHITAAVERAGLRADDLPNLRITADVNAQDLILESDVVVAFGSTTAMEAAIAGLPVIFPLFDEALDPRYEDYIQLLHDRDAFDVANSCEHFAELIRQRLDNPVIDEETMALRKRLFIKYISPVDYSAVSAYSETLGQLIDQARQKRKGVQTIR